MDKEDVRKGICIESSPRVSTLYCPLCSQATLGDECARITYLGLIKSFFQKIEIKSVLAEDKSIVTFLNRVRCI